MSHIRTDVFVAFTVLLVLGADRVTAQEPPFLPSGRALDALIDPTKDDWVAEATQVLVNRQLKALAEALQRSDGQLLSEVLDRILDSDATGPRLFPGKPHATKSAGGFHVLRAPTGGSSPEWSARAALVALFAVLKEAEVSRVGFKIIGVEQVAKGLLRTRVRYEFAGGRGKGPMQQVAVWSIDWMIPGADAVPLIRAIRSESFEQVSLPRRLFTDCTAAVLGDGVWTRHLARGGEYWHGRLDAVGEPNLMGHQGIAVGDVNGDGLEDLYVAMGNGLPNKLLLQQKDGSVIDVARSAGVAWLDDTKGVLFADMDNDGDQDLLCAMGPTIVLCKNGGQGRFNRMVKMRSPTPAAFYSLAVADYDLDGDLDIFGCRYVALRYAVSIPLPFHDANNGPTNHLLRNEGEDRYVDVTFRVGLHVNNSRFSLACGWCDYDGDGDPDLYVANDFGRNNLYRNDGGKFVDVAAEAGVEDQAAGMGVSWSDFDLDGDFDLYVTNMFSAAGNRIAYQKRFHAGTAVADRLGIQRHSQGNSLFINKGDGTFRENGQQNHSTAVHAKN